MRKTLAALVVAFFMTVVLPVVPSWAGQTTGEPEVVTPEAPTVDPLDCDDGDGYAAMIVIPYVNGVAYSTEGRMVEPGEYEVTAETLTDDFVLAEDSVTEWTLTVDPVDECEVPAAPTEELPDTGAPWLLALIGASTLATGGGLVALRRRFTE